MPQRQTRARFNNTLFSFFRPSGPSLPFFVHHGGREGKTNKNYKFQNTVDIGYPHVRYCIYFFNIRIFFQVFGLFLILKSVFTPRLFLARKHEKSEPCNRNLYRQNSLRNISFQRCLNVNLTFRQRSTNVKFQRQS